MNDNEPCSNPYYDSLGRTASDTRDELRNKIQETINVNQELFIAHWIKQHPDVDLSTITLCHGFKGNYYTFWVDYKDGK